MRSARKTGHGELPGSAERDEAPQDGIIMHCRPGSRQVQPFFRIVFGETP